MNDTPLVSVVIPNYNYGRYLGQAIDSVLAQTYPRLEVIVVDDGSTDDSVGVLTKYASRVRWIRQRNQGVSAARNQGIREANGDLIGFLDADDLWNPDKLTQQVVLLAKPAVGMVYSGLQYITASGQSLGTNLSGGHGHLLRELALLRGPGVPATGSSALVRSECFKRVGLFDTELSTSADWDMWRRIACHYEIEIVRAPLVSYRLHETAMHRNIDRFEQDMLRAFSRMFTDPSAQELEPLRRRCYGNLYMTLSGSCFHAGRRLKAVQYALRSLLVWPPGLTYVAGLPMRRVRRQAHLGPSSLDSVG
jgi:glycosyltransferase involved in cell wall biosynthesis